MDIEKVKQFRSLLPQRVSAKIESSEDGLWASLTSKDGRLSHCYTQANNITELLPMINDAILTHFEIPEDVKKDMGYYIPLPKSHLSLEEMFNRLVAVEKQANLEGESETTLTLNESELQVC